MPHRIMPFWGGWEIRTFELFREFQVGSNVFRSGMKPDEYPFYAYAPVVDGVAQFENARFYIDKDGNLKATNAEIEGKIVTGAGSEIDGAYIKNLTVTSAKIANGAITTAKIANLAVTDAKIKDVSADKLTAGTIDASIIDVINIKADNITTGTLTGRTIQTDTPGKFRLVMKSGAEETWPNSLEMVSAANAHIGGILFEPTGDIELVGESFYINADPITVEGHLQVPISNTYDIGEPNYRWRHLYLSGNIYIDGLVDGVDVSAFKSSFDTHKSTHYSSGGDLYVPTNIRNVHWLYFDQSFGRILWGPDTIFDFEAAEIEVYKNLKPIGTDKSLGYSDAKWSDLWVVNLHTGDIDLGNNFKIKEEGDDKIAFYNPKGDKVMVLDKKGNLYLKGQVKQL